MTQKGITRKSVQSAAGDDAIYSNPTTTPHFERLSFLTSLENCQLLSDCAVEARSFAVSFDSSSLVGPCKNTNCLTVRMFAPRTTFLNSIVWLLAASQLLLQPASELLHSGCDGHSHVEVAVSDPQSLWESVAATWHRLTHSHCCDHTDAEPLRANVGSEARSCSSGHSCRAHDIPSTADTGRDSEDSPAPEHDHDQCPICQVIFAARVNAVAVQLPEQTGSMPYALPDAIAAADIAARFTLPSRGPPTV